MAAVDNNLARTSPNGVLVSQNATSITDDPLASGATALNLTDPALFAQNDYIIVNAETVQKTDAGSTNPLTIGRAESDHNGDATVAVEHPTGSFARKQNSPTSVLSFVFDGSTQFAGASVTGEATFWAALAAGSTILSVKTAADNYPFVDWLYPRFAPSAATWYIYVWTLEDRLFWAEMFN